jgi:hypothetical protein
MVKVLALPKRRIKLLKRRLRKRMDVYVHCHVEGRSVFRKRRKSRVVRCPNGVVSAINRAVCRHGKSACSFRLPPRVTVSATFVSAWQLKLGTAQRTNFAPEYAFE